MSSYFFQWTYLNPQSLVRQERCTASASDSPYRGPCLLAPGTVRRRISTPEPRPQLEAVSHFPHSQNVKITMSPLATVILILTPDDASNATIYDASGEAVYTVTTQLGWSASTTQAENISGEVVAMVEWRDVLPNRLTLGKKPPTSLRNWLQTSLVPYSSRGFVILPLLLPNRTFYSFAAHRNASFKDDSGRKYQWKGTTFSRTLEVCDIEPSCTT